MKPLRSALTILIVCFCSFDGSAQRLPPAELRTPAMVQALEGLITTFDSIEVTQRKRLFYYARKDLYQRRTLTEEDKKERLMNGYSFICVRSPHEPVGSFSYRYYTLSHFVAGRREGTWEYYTGMGKLFKREEYRRGRRKRVELVP